MKMKRFILGMLAAIFFMTYGFYKVFDVFGRVDAKSLSDLQPYTFYMVLCFLCFIISVLIARSGMYSLRVKKIVKRELSYVETQIQRWRNGELEAKLESSPLGGKGECWVIEPEPGHKIVVGSSGKGKSFKQKSE